MPNIMQVAANAQGSPVKNDTAGSFSDVEMIETNGREFAALMQSPQQEQSQRQLFARQSISVDGAQKRFDRPEQSNELPQSTLSEQLADRPKKASETGQWIDSIEGMRELLMSDEAIGDEAEGSVELDAEHKAMLDEMAQWLEKLDAELAQNQSADSELTLEQQQALDSLVEQVGSMRQLIADAEQRGSLPISQLDKASDDLLAQLNSFESEVIKPQIAEQWTEVEQVLSNQQKAPEAVSELDLPKLDAQQRAWLREQLNQFRQAHPDASLDEGMAHVKALLTDNKPFDASQRQAMVAWVEKYQSNLRQTDNKVSLVAVAAPTFQAQKAVSERSSGDAKSPTVGSPSLSASDVDTSKPQQGKNEDTKPSADQSTIAKMVKEELKATTDNGNSNPRASESHISATLGQSSNVADHTASTHQTQQSPNHVSAVTQTQQTLTKIDGMSVAQAQSAIDKPLDLQQQDAAQKMQERIQMMVSKNIQRADIRLDPPELGSMHVRIHTQGDQTTVQFQVQSTQARDAIDQTMPRLREMLEQQGLNLAESSVSEQQGERGDGASSRTAQGGSGTADDSVTQMEATVDDFLAQGRLDFYV
ncbi:flagellar hook-length control protein FliK [Idiomarina sp.]|uniref:flagellar hook-length control protein FliK n=1 Tax=Idiomarina sp. TaxID=1874361 RepID=UPI0035163119